MKEKWNIVLPTLLVLAFAVTRWPGMMPPNFSAAYALVFCAGVYFPPRIAWWLPLTTMLGTDILMNLFYYHTAAVSKFMLINYVLYCGLILLGRKFGPKASFLKLLGGGVLGALLFYVISNTFAWLGNPAYVKTFVGWIKALTSGIDGFPPTWTFFRNTLMSGGLFTALFVGAMKTAEAAEPEPKEEAESESEEAESAPEGEEAKA